MAAQVRRLLATTTYDLITSPSVPAEPLLLMAKARTRAQTAFWPGDDPNGHRLERCLRLPKGF